MHSEILRNLLGSLSTLMNTALLFAIRRAKKILQAISMNHGISAMWVLRLLQSAMKEAFALRNISASTHIIIKKKTASKF